MESLNDFQTDIQILGVWWTLFRMFSLKENEYEIQKRRLEAINELEGKKDV